MKLSKTQETLINNVKAEIDYARNTDFITWLYQDKDGNRNYNCSITKENILNRIDLEYYKRCYENYRNGIALTITSSATLKSLQNKNIIEIINDARLGVDTIKLLNY